MSIQWCLRFDTSQFDWFRFERGADQSTEEQGYLRLASGLPPVERLIDLRDLEHVEFQADTSRDGRPCWLITWQVRNGERASIRVRPTEAFRIFDTLRPRSVTPPAEPCQALSSESRPSVVSERS